MPPCCNGGGSRMCGGMGELKGLADARAWAREQLQVDPEWSAVAVLPQVLDAEECAWCHRAAQQCGERLADVGGGPFAGGGLCDTLSTFSHDVAFSDEHIALYLHYDGFLQRECPALYAKLHAAMTQQSRVPSDPAVPLQLRCAEFHSYAEGGGLLAPGHRDEGSTLTLSVLLSEPDSFGGGEFVTWRDALPVAHALRKGDAVLFHSCRAHNVAQVTRGLRQSLVIELWTGDVNVSDRNG